MKSTKHWNEMSCYNHVYHVYVTSLTATYTLSCRTKNCFTLHEWHIVSTTVYIYTMASFILAQTHTYLFSQEVIHDSVSTFFANTESHIDSELRWWYTMEWAFFCTLRKSDDTTSLILLLQHLVKPLHFSLEESIALWPLSPHKTSLVLSRPKSPS